MSPLAPDAGADEAKSRGPSDDGNSAELDITVRQIMSTFLETTVPPCVMGLSARSFQTPRSKAEQSEQLIPKL